MDLEKEITHSLMLVDYERGVSQEDVIRIAQDYAKEKAFILFQEVWWSRADPSLMPNDYDALSDIKEDFEKWWEENK